MLSRKNKIVLLVFTVILVGGLFLALVFARAPRTLDLAPYTPRGATLIEAVENPDHSVYRFETTGNYADLEKELDAAFGMGSVGSMAITSMSPPAFLHSFVEPRTACIISDANRSPAQSRLYVFTTPTRVIWAHISAPQTNQPPKLVLGGRILSGPPQRPVDAAVRIGVPTLKDIQYEPAIPRSGGSAGNLSVQALMTTNSIPDVLRFYEQRSMRAPRQALETSKTDPFRETISWWITPNALYLSIVNRAAGETNTFIENAVVELW